MIRNVLVAQLLLLVLAIPGVCGELALTPAEIASRIQGKYEKSQAFRADFQQTSTVGGMQHRQRHGRGTMAIQKPSFLRWDYSEPEQQVLVSDGKEFFLYFAGERQMIVTPAKEYLQEDVTYSFFSGTGNLLRDFEVTEVPGYLAGEEGAAIALRPKKPHPQVDVMHVWVDENTYLVTRLQVFDHLGSVTELVFANPVVDQPYPEEFFRFTPPEGTEIIRQ